MSDPMNLKSSKGAVFLQKAPGLQPQYLGCVNLDDIVSSRGEQTLSYCRDETGKIKVSSRSRGLPGAVTTGIEAFRFPQRDILDDLTDCPIALYAQIRDCDRADTFPKAVRGTNVHGAVITQITESNLVKRVDDIDVLLKMTLSGDFPEYRYRRVKAGAMGNSPDAALADIAFCNGVECAGECGEFKEACQNGVAIGEASGSAVTPTVYVTDDGGLSWAASATAPFAAGNAASQAAALKSVICFEIAPGVTRYIVARGTAAATKNAISISDDGGATWTIVSLDDSLAAAFCEGPASLFAIDQYHIWLVDSNGYIFFSEDGGLTWTLLDAGVASSAAALNAIHFADKLNGFAVGPAGLVISTVDGGETWAAQTATGGGALNSVFAFNANRVIVGGATATLFMTYDGGLTWSTRSVPLGSGTVKDIEFLDEYNGFLVIGDDLARSIDGGYTWELYTSPGTFVAAAVYPCDPNNAFFAGTSGGGDPSVVKLN